jgi:predicted RNA binding protein with dsRBD fold (UPF0201 family)
MKAEGSVRFYPTEDPEKVRRSIENIFPGSRIRKDGDFFSFSTNDLSLFIDRLTEQRIRSTARMLIEKNIDNSGSRFHINKQAALAGKVNFTDGDSPLGDIEVRITEGLDDLLPILEVRD